VVGEVADERLLRFWERFGFERTGEAPSYYNGRAYHKIEGHFGRANAGLIDEGVGEAEAFYRWCETSPVSVVSQAA
jgi:ribosomal protein S18 acetylase RimI-like enzyme